jgi:site-specific DNA recombinase
MTMKKERIKVYIYTRVSTAMQIDGYSLDAQKSRMKAYAEFNDYEIVGEYEDEAVIIGLKTLRLKKC